MGVKLVSSSGGSVELVAPTTASNYQLTVPATADTLATQTYASQFATMRNRIINGAMMIDQRNAGAAVTPTGGVTTVDRWNLAISQASKLTFQQSTTAPAGFKNSLLTTVAAAVASPIATDQFLYRQMIEGLNVADLGWGTANAQTVTVSFWVRSSVTGTFPVAVLNDGYNRSYVATYTISAANTWEQKSVTIAGDTTGTWTTDNSSGIRLTFALGTGSNRTTANANTWQGAEYCSVSGCTNLLATLGATFYITGVQLEKGSTATGFDYRPYGTELALCQRYYSKSYVQSTVPGTASAQAGAYMNPIVASGNTLRATPQWKVTMRTAPTVTVYNPETGTSGYWAAEGGGATSQAAAGVTYISDSSAVVYSVSAPISSAYYFQYKAEAEL